MGPIDFNVDVQSPFQAALQGYQAGTAIRDDQLKQQQMQAALQQQQRQAQMLQSLMSNPNATAKDYANATLLMPQLKDNFKQAWEMKSAEQQQSGLKDMSQYYAAVASGRPDIAAQQMNARAEAMLAAGVPKREVDALRSQAEVVKQNPDLARSMIGMLLASIPGGDKVISGAATLGTEARAAEQGPADLRKKNAEAGIKTVEAVFAPQKLQTEIDNTLSQMVERAARLNLDRDKLTTDTQIKLTELNKQFGELPTDARKNLNDAAAAATVSEQSAAQMSQLASKLDAAAMSSGAVAKGAELYKQLTGNQDAVTALRQEYTRLRSTGVMKLLPPGPATDRDVSLAMEGFPPPTADAKQLASFLRGMSKMQTYDAVLNNAKAQWFGEVQHLGATKKDITIDGVKVPAGSSFNDFASKYVAKRAQQATGASLVNSLAEKYGGSPAAPGAPAAVPDAAGVTGTF